MLKRRDSFHSKYIYRKKEPHELLVELALHKTHMAAQRNPDAQNHHTQDFIHFNTVAAGLETQEVCSKQWDIGSI